MADNFPVTPGTGRSVATDEIGGIDHQKVKVEFGENGTATEASAANPLPTTDAGVKTLIEALKALLEGTAVVKVTDNAGSLTVDAPLSTPVGVRLSDGTSAIGATSQRLHVDDGGSTLSVDDGAGSLTVDGTVALGAGTAEVGKIKVTELPALVAGTAAIGKLAANSGVDIGDVDVTSLTGGTVAHDAADSGNPIKIGGRARTAFPTAVAQDDRVDNVADKFGRTTVVTAPVDARVSGSIDITGTETTDVIAAPGASIAIVVTDIEVSNGDATVGTFVEIFDDATKKWKGYAGALGGGFSQSNPDGLFICTANKAVRAKCVTTSSETAVNISGYKVPA